MTRKLAHERMKEIAPLTFVGNGNLSLSLCRITDMGYGVGQMANHSYLPYICPSDGDTINLPIAYSAEEAQQDLQKWRLAYIKRCLKVAKAVNSRGK